MNTLKTKAFISLFLLICCFSIQNLSAQNQNREFGLRFSSTNNYSLMYKKEKNPLKYRRYMFSANVDMAYFFNGAANFGFAFGTEKRIELLKNFKAVHGFMPSINVSATPNFIYGGVGLGYILGLQYEFGDKFYVGAEVVPGAGIGAFNNDLALLNFQLSSPISLSAVYRFQKKAKESTK